MHMICQKAHRSSCLHISMFITKYFHWLIMNYGCKLFHDWSRHSMLTEAAAHRMSCTNETPNSAYCSIFSFLPHKVNIKV
jgi:hypothetical protein